MTLEEAIKNIETIAEENQRVVDTGIVYDDVTIDMLYCDDTEVIEEHLANYQRCAEEQRQLAEWLKELNQLREQTRWIPVSERLPDKEGQYLVTFQSSSFGVSSMEIANFSLDLSNASFLFRHEKSRSGWWGRDDGGWNTFIYSGVIAWMPIPKPYKPQESEGNE